MLRILPTWWHSFMVWLDTTTVPLWLLVVAFVVVLVYLLATAYRDLHNAWRDPPPFDQ